MEATVSRQPAHLQLDGLPFDLVVARRIELVPRSAVDADRSELQQGELGERTHLTFLEGLDSGHAEPGPQQGDGTGGGVRQRVRR